MARLQRFRPSAALRHRVASIEIIEGGGHAVILPSSSAVLGFQYRGRVRAGDALLAPAGITGIQSKARTYSYEPNTGSVLIRFTPDGVNCLGIPGAQLANQSVALDVLLPQARVAEARERLDAAGDAAARIAAIEAFLTGLPYVPDPVVTRALVLLDNAAEGGSISETAGALGLSVRQLERRFLARVGVTPKRFVALRRLERALASVKTRASWTAAAVDAGYYDQSHFIRDFRRFAGTTPRKFFR